MYNKNSNGIFHKFKQKNYVDKFKRNILSRIKMLVCVENVI